MSLPSVDLLTFVAGLALLIIAHELGHFIAARLFGVEVEEFGIGFPPRLVKLFEYKGTEYTLNWIPLGGFVRPKGENDPSVEGGLAAASPWVRLGVLFAGPLTNIAIGLILAVMLFYNMGEPIAEQVLIQGVAPGSPAEQAGLQAGDLIVRVDQTEIDSIPLLQDEIAQRQGQETQLVYQRDGQTYTTTLVPRENPPEDEGATGILLTNPTRPISMGDAVGEGIAATYQQVRGIILLPVHLISGEVSGEEARPVGYKGMFDIYQQISNQVWFFMVISISLGVLNLFPIPALDGGRILLTLPEILLRKRIPPEYENMIHLVGFTLLIILIIFINVQDFVNPIQLP